MQRCFWLIVLRGTHEDASSDSVHYLGNKVVWTGIRRLSPYGWGLKYHWHYGNFVGRIKDVFFRREGGIWGRPLFLEIQQYDVGKSRLPKKNTPRCSLRPRAFFLLAQEPCTTVWPIHKQSASFYCALEIGVLVVPLAIGILYFWQVWTVGRSHGDKRSGFVKVQQMAIESWKSWAHIYVTAH